MKTVQVTLSSKHQLVIPRDIRRRLQLQPGVKLIVTAEDAETIHIRKTGGVARAMFGLGKELWEATGGSEQYLKALRKGWREREQDLEGFVRESRQARRARRS